mmetsp:Transcript_71035/g.200550  ORF Transcript_71035/g.200550 Transcript_71035/m.200550 type:complete len:216 (-) Transcript_71035:88-735(-)
MADARIVMSSSERPACRGWARRAASYLPSHSRRKSRRPMALTRTGPRKPGSTMHARTFDCALVKAAASSGVRSMPRCSRCSTRCTHIFTSLATWKGLPAAWLIRSQSAASAAMSWAFQFWLAGPRSSSIIGRTHACCSGERPSVKVFPGISGQKQGFRRMKPRSLPRQISPLFHRDGTAWSCREHSAWVSTAVDPGPGNGAVSPPSWERQRSSFE